MLAVPTALGGIVACLAKARNAQPSRMGLLFAAGIITGEALIGIVLAAPIVVSGRADILALPFGLGSAGGLAVLAAVRYRIGKNGNTEQPPSTR